jgi:hypothetical protein
MVACSDRFAEDLQCHVGWLTLVVGGLQGMCVARGSEKRLLQAGLPSHSLHCILSSQFMVSQSLANS